jgi:hypothetical protein
MILEDTIVVVHSAPRVERFDTSMLSACHHLSNFNQPNALTAALGMIERRTRSSWNA